MCRNIFLIVGPSGSGKTSLVNALLASHSGLTRAVTVTTRQPRPGEMNGKDYVFVSREEFEKMRAFDDFFETDTVFGEFYGIPRSVDEQEGDLVFIVTLAGARAVKRVCPEAKTILILPKSAEDARRRVIERRAPNEDERISGYETELRAAIAYSHEVDFEAVIENGCFEDALCELSVAFMRSSRDSTRTAVSTKG